MELRGLVAARGGGSNTTTYDEEGDGEDKGEGRERERVDYLIVQDYNNGGGLGQRKEARLRCNTKVYRSVIRSGDRLPHTHTLSVSALRHSVRIRMCIIIRPGFSTCLRT